MSGLRGALFGVACALLLLGAPAAALAADPPPAPQPGAAAAPPSRPSAAALARRAFAQLHGFDALEAYEGRGSATSMDFAVARKWSLRGARIALYVERPAHLDELAFLMLQHRGGGEDLFIYLTPQIFPRGYAGRVRRLPGPRMDYALPNGGPMPLLEFRPLDPEGFDFRHLAPAAVEAEPCDVIEGRPTRRGLGFDRLVLTLSRRTGVALRSRYFRGERELRRVEVAPGDVTRHAYGWLPSRRKIYAPNGRLSAELILRNLVVDPQLPDSLFTHRALRFQRFPSF